MSDVYQVPESSGEESASLSFWNRFFKIAVIAFIAGPVIGIGGSVIGLISAFDTMGVAGGSDPAELASDISLAVWSSMVGWIIGLITLPILVVAFVGRRRHRKFAS